MQVRQSTCITTYMRNHYSNSAIQIVHTFETQHLQFRQDMNI